MLWMTAAALPSASTAQLNVVSPAARGDGERGRGRAGAAEPRGALGEVRRVEQALERDVAEAPGRTGGGRGPRTRARSRGRRRRRSPRGRRPAPRRRRGRASRGSAGRRSPASSAAARRRCGRGSVMRAGSTQSLRCAARSSAVRTPPSRARYAPIAARDLALVERVAARPSRSPRACPRAAGGGRPRRGAAGRRRDAGRRRRSRASRRAGRGTRPRSGRASPRAGSRRGRGRSRGAGSRRTAPPEARMRLDPAVDGARDRERRARPARGDLARRPPRRLERRGGGRAAARVEDVLGPVAASWISQNASPPTPVMCG